jgi:HK97 family phage major capsid protein
MSVDKITELRHKAAHQLAEMRRIVDENETLSAEQAAEYDRREADLDEINAQVARLEKLAGIAPTFVLGGSRPCPWRARRRRLRRGCSRGP